MLSDSLPPLDEDRLREVAEGFDRLEAHRTELADRRRSLTAVEDFLQVYADYAAVVAAVRGREFAKADYGVRRAAEDERTARDDHDAAVADRDELTHRIREVDGQLRAAEERLATLRQSDAYRAVQDLEQAQQQHAAARRRADEAEKRRDGSREELAAATDELARVEERLAAWAATVDAAERTARAAAGDADLVNEHAGVVGGLARRDELDDDAVETALGTAHGALGTVAEDRDRAIARVAAAHDQLAEAEQGADRAQAARDDVDAAVRDAAVAATSAEEEVAAARDEFADGVRDWADESATVGLDGTAVAALVDTDPEQAAAAARHAAVPRRDELDAAVVGARSDLDRVEVELADVRAEHDELALCLAPAATCARMADRRSHRSGGRPVLPPRRVHRRPGTG